MDQQFEVDTSEYYLPFTTFDFQRTKQTLSSRVRIDFGSVSDVGKVRQNNEDAYLIYRVGRFWEKVHTNLDNQKLPDRHEENAYAMAVADGMGGLSAGEVASSMVITTVVNLVLSSVKWALKLDQSETREQEIQEGIDRAISYLSQADRAISRRAKEEGASKMGTTLTAAYIVGEDLFIFHVGDSRAYLLRKGELTQLTSDHTVAQALADSGAIPQSAVEHHHFKHMLTRAIGLHEGGVEVEIHHLKLSNDDRVLLCSDGLSDLVKAEEIQKVLSSKSKSQSQCDKLLDLALKYGGKDNITALIGHYRLS